MIRVKQNTNCLFTELNLHRWFTPKRTHCIVFLCWISLIVIGTFLIGLSTDLYTKEFTYCQDNESFCSRQFTLTDKKEILFYIVLENFHQNNRMYLIHELGFWTHIVPCSFRAIFITTITVKTMTLTNS